MQQVQECIELTVSMLRALGAKAPRVAMILGSGLGEYANGIEHARALPYAEIPGFPQSNVAGHAGRFVLGEKFGIPVIAMQGRVHYYEGHPQPQLTIGVRAMRSLGADTLLVTNAAGGVNAAWKPGSLMLIEDHINFSGSHPLIGDNLDSFGPRFPDLSSVYSRDLRERTKAAAAGEGIELVEGVYMMFSGPTYETPAEVRMARTMGADAVGMSTVPEAIAAAHCGMQVLGISLIANPAAGILQQALSHEEVQQVARESSARFTRLVDAILRDVLV